MSNHVTQRIDFAERRLLELLALNGGDLNGADELERQQLVQEFFFHLVGSIEMLAASVNDSRKLAISEDTVTVSQVINKLPSNDPVKAKLSALYARTRNQPIPANPYEERGYVFRLYNYRNQVSHRGRNPWTFYRGGDLPLIALQLDPRVRFGGSNLSVQDDLRNMLTVVRTRINQILTMI
jgi:hypothetical protein